MLEVVIILNIYHFASKITEKSSHTVLDRVTKMMRMKVTRNNLKLKGGMKGVKFIIFIFSFIFLVSKKSNLNPN